MKDISYNQKMKNHNIILWKESLNIDDQQSEEPPLTRFDNWNRLT